MELTSQDKASPPDNKSETPLKEKSNNLSWYTINPDANCPWLAPDKDKKKYFGTKTEIGKENCAKISCIKVLHHKKPKNVSICLQYICLGSCRAGCLRAHRPHLKLTDEAAKQKFDDAFSEIYSS